MEESSDHSHFEEEDPGQEVRAMETRELLESLASKLPPNTWSRSSDRSALKKEAINLVRSWPVELLDIIQNTPEDIVVKTPLADRWLWPGLTPPASKGGVVVVGDAWHPMTPNLAQGGCCALEDAVVLPRKLAAAIGGGQGMIDAALIDYGQERWARVFPLTVRANLVGSLLQSKNPLVCTIRNDFVLRKIEETC